jgi:hypothetical protein
MRNTIETTRSRQYGEYREQSIKGGSEYLSVLPSMVNQAYHVIDGYQITQYSSARIARESRQSVKVTGGEVFLFVVGAACVIAGMVTHIWPVALGSICPCLLALVDIFERKSRRPSTK